MDKKVFITEDERKKCRKVADAFRELYEQEDIIVLDAGRYGFVKLQYYSPERGFDDQMVFTDSGALFEALWQEWQDRKARLLTEGVPFSEMCTEDILKLFYNEKIKINGLKN